MKTLYALIPEEIEKLKTFFPPREIINSCIEIEKKYNVDIFGSPVHTTIQHVINYIREHVQSEMLKEDRYNFKYNLNLKQNEPKKNIELFEEYLHFERKEILDFFENLKKIWKNRETFFNFVRYDLGIEHPANDFEYKTIFKLNEKEYSNYLNGLKFENKDNKKDIERYKALVKEFQFFAENYKLSAYQFPKGFGYMGSNESINTFLLYNKFYP